MSIPDSIIQEIRQRVSIADIAAEFVELKRSGRSLMACCPFHQEKTPSFHVHEEEGYFKCFGCGKKGDVFTLLMELRHWNFPESIQFLATRCGISLPERRTEDTSREVNSQLRKLATAVAQSFSYFLWEEPFAEHARSYLASRGLEREVCQAFGLGFAPSRLEPLLEALRFRLASDIDQETMLEGLHTLGLIRTASEEKGGRTYPFFRDRLLFPIMRSDGCPIAFGGRILTASEGAPKYINSPESPIYQKRRSLYGVSQAAAALRKQRIALMVEGYTDVLALHQAGIEHVLATCGTAVSEEHAQVLRRLADTVVVVFDGDASGRAAAARCFERFLNAGVELQVLFLPKEEDPDSLVRKEGKERFLQRVANESQSAFSAYLDCALEDAGAKGIVQRAKVAEQAMRIVAKVQNPVERELLAKAAAMQLEVEVASVLQLLHSQAQLVGQAKFIGQAKSTGATSTGRGQQGASSTSRSSKQQPALAHTQRVKSLAQTPSSSMQKSQDEPLRVRPQAARKVKRSNIDAYAEQLLVALVCQPELAKKVLAIPSLFETAKLEETRARQIQAVLRVLNSDEAPRGVLEIRDLAELEECRSNWTKVLEECGVQSSAIIEEAIRQSRVGGINPKDLLLDAQWVEVRSSMAEQLQVLRAAEAQAGDAKDKLNLAQEKLKARRAMDKLYSREQK